MKLCDFGCRREAVHQFKNGKWCCDKFTFRCPAIKKRSKKTCLKKYGVKNPTQNKEIRNKLEKGRLLLLINKTP